MPIWLYSYITSSLNQILDVQNIVIASSIYIILYHLHGFSYSYLFSLLFKYLILFKLVVDIFSIIRFTFK